MKRGKRTKNDKKKVFFFILLKYQSFFIQEMFLISKNTQIVNLHFHTKWQLIPPSKEITKSDDGSSFNCFDLCRTSGYIIIYYRFLLPDSLFGAGLAENVRLLHVI